MDQIEAQEVSKKLSNLGCQMLDTHALSAAMTSSLGSSVFVACWHPKSNKNFCAGHLDRADRMFECPLLINTETLNELIKSA